MGDRGVLPSLNVGAGWVADISESNGRHSHRGSIGTSPPIVEVVLTTLEPEVVPAPVASSPSSAPRRGSHCCSGTASVVEPVPQFLLGKVFMVHRPIWADGSSNRERQLGVIGVVAGLDVVDAREEAATSPLVPGGEVGNRVLQTNCMQVLRFWYGHELAVRMDLWVPGPPHVLRVLWTDEKSRLDRRGTTARVAGLLAHAQPHLLDSVDVIEVWQLRYRQQARWRVEDLEPHLPRLRVLMDWAAEQLERQSA